MSLLTSYTWQLTFILLLLLWYTLSLSLGTEFDRNNLKDGNLSSLCFCTTTGPKMAIEPLLEQFSLGDCSLGT